MTNRSISFFPEKLAVSLAARYEKEKRHTGIIENSVRASCITSSVRNTEYKQDVYNIRNDGAREIEEASLHGMTAGTCVM